MMLRCWYWTARLLDRLDVLAVRLIETGPRNTPPGGHGRYGGVSR